MRARKARKQAKRDDKIIAAAEAEEERQRKAERALLLWPAALAPTPPDPAVRTFLAKAVK